ncbi:heavy metal-associated isoprenylated plant protein 33 [Forsythia ovata]|uniref:Heavy metal-associated isoprenylated plant protein 33 n=1 Tax=Forsythia ovata TaxID=205694 RepID=A0ABD1T868_9LAMI
MSLSKDGCKGNNNSYLEIPLCCLHRGREDKEESLKNWVYTTKIDSEQGKVTVSGNVDPATLIKKLAKSGKHAEIWGAPKPNNNNQNQLNNQLKNLQIDNGKGGNNKGQGQKGGNNQPKGGPQGGQNPQLQQLQQLQQMKGFQDLKLPPNFMKDMKMPPLNNKDQNPKSVKFNLPEDEGLTDDEFDDEFDDDEFDDDEFDDEINEPLKKPIMGNGHMGAPMPNIMNNMMMKGGAPPNGGNNGGNAGNGKKGGGGGGGGGNIPVQGNMGGGNQNQGGGKGGKNGGDGEYANGPYG